MIKAMKISIPNQYYRKEIEKDNDLIINYKFLNNKKAISKD